MSRDNMELVRSLCAAFDADWPFTVYDAEVEWGVRRLPFRDELGPDGVRGFWRQRLEAWQSIELQPFAVAGLA
jgi:hypothetical protein